MWEREKIEKSLSSDMPGVWDEDDTGILPTWFYFTRWGVLFDRRTG